MKHSYLRHILLCLCLLAGINVFAYDALIDGIYYNFSGNEATVTGGEGHDSYSGVVSIPDAVEYNGKTYRVTSIGEEAFCETYVKIVNIPESVTYIGKKAFGDCEGLISVSIPENVTYIGELAFKYCEGLISISIPENVAYIGEQAFKGCSSLTSIKVSEGNAKYDSRNNCNAIIETETNTLIAGCQKTVIPAGIKSIGSHAFQGCTGLTSITIPKGVTSIGDWAFVDCAGLTSINIPNSVTSIGDEAFRGCEGLTSVHITDLAAWCNIAFENNPLDYAHHLYLNGQEITHLVIPNSVSNISDYAFSGCSGLTSVTIPNSVTGIGDYAFDECNNLTSVTIPNSVTSIGRGAFRDCSGLTSVRVGMAKPIGIYDNTFTNRRNATLYVPLGSVYEYGEADYWEEFKEIVGLEESVIEADGLYYQLTNSNAINAKIGQIVLPSNSDVAIVVEAPRGHSYNNFNCIEIPSSIKSAGKTYPVVAIDECAFAEFKEGGPKCVVIPNYVVYIAEEAFVESVTLERVEIPNSVRFIGEDAFGDCESLKEIVSFIQNPFAIHTSVFRDIANDATLYVPFGTKTLYEATAGWSTIVNIVEMEPDKKTDISQMDNVIYLEGAEAIADGGMATLRVKMKNSVDAAGFDFDMYLPEGCHFALDEDEEPDTELSRERFSLSEINNRRFFKRKLNEDGSLNAYAVYDTDKTIAGNDGTIVLVRIIVDEGVSIGEHPIVLKNWGVTDYFGSVLPKPINDPVAYPLDIIDMKRGDANGDEGPRINTGDFRTVTNYILGLPIGNLNETCADANGDGVIDVGDLTAMSNLLNYGTIYRPQK